MQLNLTTDYAIRCMVYLAQHPKGDNKGRIAEAAGIQLAHAQKILRILKQHGLVQSTLGRAGGFSLSRSPDQISLLDIISAMETTILINRCLEEDQFCSLARTGSCPVRAVYVGIQKHLEQHLESWTLAKLLDSV